MLRALALGLCILTLAPLAQGADEIYRWVDESGIVHFGDEPPPNGATDVQTMELEIPPAPEGAAEDYSIQSQLERLYRTRPKPPEKPDKSPSRQNTPYRAPPTVIYQPLYGPYYGYPPKARPGHPPAHPGWHPHPPHKPVPPPAVPQAPSGRLWLPR